MDPVNKVQHPTQKYDPQSRKPLSKNHQVKLNPDPKEGGIRRSIGTDGAINRMRSISETPTNLTKTHEVRRSNPSNLRASFGYKNQAPLLEILDFASEENIFSKVDNQETKAHQRNQEKYKEIDQKNWDITPSTKEDTQRFNIAGRETYLGTTEEYFLDSDKGLEKNLGGESLGYQFTRDLGQGMAGSVFIVFGKKFKANFKTATKDDSWDAFIPQEAFRNEIKDPVAIRKAAVFCTQAASAKVFEQVRSKYGYSSGIATETSINIDRQKNGDIIIKKYFNFRLKDPDKIPMEMGCKALLTINLSRINEKVKLKISDKYNIT